MGWMRAANCKRNPCLIFSFTKEVFEDDKAARDWLHQPQMGLGGRVPLDFIRTEAGAREDWSRTTVTI
jgi:uncharacterized protein (DUF2384 family)